MVRLRLSGADRLRAARFAILGNLLPIAIAVIANLDTGRPVFFLGALIVALVPLPVTLGSREHPIIFYSAAYGGLVGITLMQAHTGGIASGYSLLTLMAMVWFGLQATDREIALGVALLTICAFAPMLVLGAPAYPVSWSSAAIVTVVGTSVAVTLRAMVREVDRLTRGLREEATRDVLTGALNRRGWREHATRTLARAARSGSSVSALLIDIDGFKQLNDSIGHVAGDELLRRFAKGIEGELRAGDVFARLGGDEFAVLLEGVSSAEAGGLSKRLLEVAEQPFSAGLGAWGDGETPEQLLHRCDLGLYEAKAAGGGRVVDAPEIGKVARPFNPSTRRT